MKKIAFDRKITLLELKPQSRVEKPLETARAVVWANVSEPGVTTKFAALQAGQSIQFSVVMWRREFYAGAASCARVEQVRPCFGNSLSDIVSREFKGFTHCEIDGVRYKIAQTGAAKNALHIKLLLERG